MTRFSQHDEPLPIDPDALLEREITFGKYKGATWEEVLERDLPYIDWLLDSEIGSVSPEEREALSELYDTYHEAADRASSYDQMSIHDFLDERD